MFIKLTLLDIVDRMLSEPLYIRHDHITAVKYFGNASTVYTSIDRTFIVKELPEDILKFIEEAEETK